MFGLNGRQLFILLLFVALLFAGSQYIPPYFNAFQFNDFVRQEVKYAVSARKTTDDVRNAIVKKAAELNLPITPKDVRIIRRGPSFTVELEYRVPVDIKVYKQDLVFRASESGEVFE